MGDARKAGYRISPGSLVEAVRQESQVILRMTRVMSVARTRVQGTINSQGALPGRHGQTRMSPTIAVASALPEL